MSCRWQAVWKLNDPSKVRIFLWRALLNILPTMEKWESKRVVPDSICCMWGHLEETVMHVLLGCDRAQGVWKLTMFECLFWKIIVMIYGGLGMLDCAYTCWIALIYLWCLCGVFGKLEIAICMKGFKWCRHM